LSSAANFAANLYYAATTFMTTVPVAEVAHGVLRVVVVGSALVFFRPLLTGIGRALVLTVRPRRTPMQLAKLRAAKLDA
jgi:hypothetical protein